MNHDVQYSTLDKLNDKAFQLLMNELGFANTVRFIQQFTTGTGNYAEQRKGLLKEWMLNDVLGKARMQRKNPDGYSGS